MSGPAPCTCTRSRSPQASHNRVTPNAARLAVDDGRFPDTEQSCPVHSGPMGVRSAHDPGQASRTHPFHHAHEVERLHEVVHDVCRHRCGIMCHVVVLPLAVCYMMSYHHTGE